MAFRLRRMGLGECGDHAIHGSGELGHDSQPCQRPTSPEVALASGTRVGLPVLRRRNRSHDFFQEPVHLRMLGDHMIPGVAGQLNDAALRVSDVRDDVMGWHALATRALDRSHSPRTPMPAITPLAGAYEMRP